MLTKTKLNMNEIICPHCKKVFKVDEAGYADILKQVRDHQFEKELSSRLALAEKDKENAVKLAEANIRNALQDQLSEKDRQLTEVKAKSNTDLIEKLAQKETEITQMKAKIENAEVEKKLALNEAIQEIEKERDKLANEVNTKKIENENIENSLKQKFETEIQNKDAIIKYKDEEIARVRDMKQKLSTKMLGETLEQHCEIEFNKLRTTAFQNAYFEKDNDASGGTKGDYIYKETDDKSNEIISIMFEMKNENDETSTKKKNEDFFAKLDKDRKDKNCEYAVLVSLLESDNEFYNNGIVDVSYKYGKMYVIRPQFFIPIITLLRNAAMNSLKYKQELNLIRNQNIDITNFEDKISQFKDGFAKNYISASNHFQKAIEEIDKSIARMQIVKQELTTSENQLRLANKKAEDLTIKKLIYNNPTMKEKFKELIKQDFFDEYDGELIESVLKNLEIEIRSKNTLQSELPKREFSTKTNTKPNITRTSSKKREVNGMKIGQYVQYSFREAFEQNLLSDSEINELQKLEYSKRIFNSSFEVLRNKKLSIQDNKGRNRYYKEIFCGNYYLTSQWFEHQWELLLVWLKKIGYEYKNNAP